MKHSLLKSTTIACITLIAGTGGLFAKTPEVPMSVYSPRDKVKQPEEVPLYDVTNFHPEVMVVNRAHWTHGAAGVVQSQRNTLPATHSMQLLTEDPAETYPLPPGKLSVTLDLGDYFNVDELIFYSVTAQGFVSVEYSNTIGNNRPAIWKSFAEKVAYDKKGTVEIDTKGINARYIKITFDSYQPGEIANLSMLGTKPININGTDYPGALENFVSSDDEVYERNLAALHRGTNISHVSSGDLEGIEDMLDNDFRTGYEFDDSDTSPVWIAKMPEGKDINKVSVLAHTNHPGTVEFYVVEGVPISENDESKGVSTTMKNGVKKVNLPPDFFEKNKPIHTEEVHPQSDWRVSTDSMEQKSGQYVVMRWVPAEGASTAGDPLVVKQIYATQTSDFKNPEIASYSLQVQSLNTQIVQGGTQGFSSGGGINTVDRVRLPDQLPVVSQ